MKTTSESDLCRTARLKTMLLQEQLSNKMLIDRESYTSLQVDLQNSKIIIEKLSKDKEDLKQALTESLSKRDKIYSKLKKYKNYLKSLKFSQEISISTLNKKFETDSINSLVASRDKKIKELYSEIEKLEHLLMKRENEVNTWKDLYSSSNYIRAETGQRTSIDYSGDILRIGEIFLMKVKKDAILYKNFKNIANCSKYFFGLLEKRTWDEALIKLLSFCDALLTSFKFESLLMRTPSFSPYMQANLDSKEERLKHVSILNPDTSGKESLGLSRSTSNSGNLKKARVARRKQNPDLLQFLSHSVSESKLIS